MHGKPKPADMDLDNASEVAARSSPKCHPFKKDDTIGLFERQDFSVHGADAQYTAAHVYQTNSVIKYLGKKFDGLPSVTLSLALVKTFLREALTTEQLKIGVWSSEGSGGVSGEFARCQSRENARTVGIAFANASIRAIGDSELWTMISSNTESLLIQLGVKDIVISERKNSEFVVKNVKQDLNRLLKEENASVTLYESNFGQYTLRHHDLSQFMRLNSSALRALDLLPSSQGQGGQGGGSSRNTGLFGFLNKCDYKTGRGMKLLGQWLEQPLVNLHEISECRQALVQAMVDDTDSRHYIELSP
ncbi:hypothetical protein BOTBODRAFT_181785 [Botryobasidium botryosum FD-172 SS1]|uniref:DNA mismatch repair protein MutS core domain-containing protein n=1 Tax=Botryobasidium botryosum (strain FD-172 SS1) TaxID=930990 RepID=A0A067LT65_BOTB1|nr:hypothetical protein BOTBODRAFT_181785 [Botryobasidium botryosum FD-172 SS1]